MYANATAREFTSEFFDHASLAWNANKNPGPFGTRTYRKKRPHKIPIFNWKQVALKTATQATQHTPERTQSFVDGFAILESKTPIASPPKVPACRAIVKSVARKGRTPRTKVLKKYRDKSITIYARRCRRRRRK